MDFEKILSQWNNIQKDKQQQEAKILKNWLVKYPPSLKDKENDVDNSGGEQKNDRIKKRQRLRTMKPQKTLDLHGLTVKEALAKVENFLIICQAQGLEKVLIIHGKGIHSKEGPVLNQKIRQFIEKSPLTGELGTPPTQLGGKGALWVIIKSLKAD